MDLPELVCRLCGVSKPLCLYRPSQLEWVKNPACSKCLKDTGKSSVWTGHAPVSRLERGFNERVPDEQWKEGRQA